ncbi:MAG: 50S ribosomal protein L6 [Patescibacteria group bacterium]|jgi:large subunit ribosomal protein L6
MSRIGKRIIVLPEKVTAQVADRKVTVKGPNGTLVLSLHPLVTVVAEKEGLKISVQDEKEKLNRSLWGTTSALLQNMVDGVSKGFSKKMEIAGVGFGWELKGDKLVLKVGYSHPVNYVIPKGVTGKIVKNVLEIAGSDKQMVGRVAAEIRAIKKPEPYKGKGIKYQGEVIRKKAGKQATTAGAS